MPLSVECSFCTYYFPDLCIIAIFMVCSNYNDIYSISIKLNYFDIFYEEQ